MVSSSSTNASTGISTQAQTNQAIELVQKHKTQIRKVLGTSTGTGFSASYSPSDSDRQRLQSEISGLNTDQVNQVLSLWPVYQMGFEDGQSETER